MDLNSLGDLRRYLTLMEVLTATTEGTSLYGPYYLRSAEELASRGWIKQVEEGDLYEMERRHPQKCKIAKREEPDSRTLVVEIEPEGKKVVEKLLLFMSQNR